MTSTRLPNDQFEEVPRYAVHERSVGLCALGYQWALIHTLLAKLIHCERGRPIDQRIREMLIACVTSVATVMLCFMLCFGDQIYA